MGQISIPAANKSGYSMFWNSMWDSKHNYSIFLKQDIFIKSSLILFLNDYSSDKLFFFLKLKTRLNFNKYFIKNLFFNKNVSYNFFYKYIRKVNNNDLFFSKIWLLRYQSWVILNVSIFVFLKDDNFKKNILINYDNWFFHYYKNLFISNKRHSLKKYIF
jgi:hypothetical protein